mmetsp:Transcript_20951/g.64577  ORF Transcript_20951/g.64577 Transcript_20951/m.64577 type:complete len:326 (+) Transcript_20951:280-1257(+)
MRPTPGLRKHDVVVEDRTRHTTYTRDLGNGLTLGGSWAAKEARLLELEQANANLQVRCAHAEARAEAPSAQNERLRMRSQLRAAQENSRMATEDALAAHFMKNVSRHEARIANACSDQCTRRLAETAARLALRTRGRRLAQGEDGPRDEVRPPREALGDGAEGKGRARPRAGPEGEARLCAVEGAGSSRKGGQGPAAEVRDAHTAQDRRAGDAYRFTVAGQDGRAVATAAAARGDAVAPEGRAGAVGGRRHARETTNAAAGAGPRPPGRGAPQVPDPRRRAQEGAREAPGPAQARRGEEQGAPGALREPPGGEAAADGRVLGSPD